MDICVCVYIEWSCSIMSDSLWSLGLLPTRLLRPWNFPGKSTEVDCHFLLQGIFLTQGQTQVSCIAGSALPSESSGIYTYVYIVYISIGHWLTQIKVPSSSWCFCFICFEFALPGSWNLIPCNWPGWVDLEENLLNNETEYYRNTFFLMHRGCDARGQHRPKRSKYKS